MTIPRPRDYLKMKYSAPPGTCKCGECQLVPPEMLMTWDVELQEMRRLLAAAKEQVSPTGVK